MASSFSKWADKLKSQQFFIISSAVRITDQDYEKSARVDSSFVLKVAEDDFQRRIVPHSGNKFSVSCVRLRNCPVIMSPYMLYLVSILVLQERRKIL